ncbi:MAG: hypothetical protein D6711_12880 [Chloroflexi bacterium]|nr:MAG: hypothetical protein D6711_12880 [Chloroflexota bacterium]
MSIYSYTTKIADFQQTKTKNKMDKFLSVVLSVIYGGFLALLPVDVFLDRINYLVYASAADLIMERYALNGVLTVLANEPVWLLLNRLLATFLSPEMIIRLIVFFPASIIAWLLLQHRKGWIGWTLLFLFFPAVIKNHVIHLRQGVAIALFLVGWYSQRKNFRYVLWLVTPFIHASFFFVLMLYVLVKIVKILRMPDEFFILMPLYISFAVGFGLPWLGFRVGARQAFEYNLRGVDISGLGFIFWLLLLIVLLSQGRQFIRRHAFEIVTVTFYLGIYFLGAVSARIYESTLLLVLLSGLDLEKRRRSVFLIMIGGFIFLSYYLRLGDPWLGWGF